MQGNPVSDVRGVWLHAKAAAGVEGEPALARQEESQMEEEGGEAEEGGERWRKSDVAHREQVLGFLSKPLAVALTLTLVYRTLASQAAPGR